MEGNVVTREEMFKGSSWSWIEVHFFKPLPKNSSNEWVQTPGNVPSVCRKVRLWLWAFWPQQSRSKKCALLICNRSLSKFRFKLRMLLRLTPQRGGDGTIHGIIAMNDTGSDILSLFNADMAHLGNLQGYAGWIGPTAILSANGTINTYPTILVQVQLVRNDNSPWSDWIDECAIVKPLLPNVPRLSGIGVRNVLYLAAAPGNHLLAVSTTKCGLASLL